VRPTYDDAHPAGAPPDNISDLYADIRTSCAASRAASAKAADDRGSHLSRSCVNCGHEIPRRRFRPLRWLLRLTLLGGVATAAAQTEWGKRLIAEQQRSAEMGHEFDTGTATVANGVEAYPSREALSVWGGELNTE